VNFFLFIADFLDFRTNRTNFSYILGRHEYGKPYVCDISF